MSNGTPAKPDFSSRTWWFNLGTAVLTAVFAAVTTYLGVPNLQVVGDSAPVAGFALPALLSFAPTVVALVNLVLRYATETPIRPFWQR